MPEEISRLHAVVEGHVQGVGFRAYVLERANRLSLTGWVRNRSNGDVEVTAEGSRPALEKLLADLYRGPGVVTGVDFDWLIATGEFDRFAVTRTSYF